VGSAYHVSQCSTVMYELNNTQYMFLFIIQYCNERKQLNNTESTVNCIINVFRFFDFPPLFSDNPTFPAFSSLLHKRFQMIHRIMVLQI
jgi:hypothetical protein